MKPSSKCLVVVASLPEPCNGQQRRRRLDWLLPIILTQVGWMRATIATQGSLLEFRQLEAVAVHHHSSAHRKQRTIMRMTCFSGEGKATHRGLLCLES